MTLTHAIEQFSQWKAWSVTGHTAEIHTMALKYFGLFLGEREVEEVRLEDIVQYLKRLEQLGWSVNYVARACLTLRHFFTFLRRDGLRVVNARLIPRPRKVSNLPRVASEEAYGRILALIPESGSPRHARDRAMLMVLWDTGMRVGELLALDVGDLDLERMRAVIKTEKSRGARPFREVFWTQATNRCLSRWIAIRERVDAAARTRALFPVIQGPTAGGRLDIRAVGELLRRYSRRAGIPTVNAHSFRHHRGHEIVERGGSAADVMNLLGHASVQSSSIYTMMMDRELEARYRRVRGWRGVSDSAGSSKEGGELRPQTKPTESTITINQLLAYEDERHH